MPQTSSGGLPKPMGRQFRSGGLTRRSFLAAGAAAGLLGAGGLPARAVPRGVPFGAAIQYEHLHDETYKQAFLDHCDIVMPMNQLKFGLLQWNRGEWNFERADTLVDLALSNGKIARGTTFVWYLTNPPWLDEVSTEREAEAVLVEHIERVAGHYRGRLAEWDVVNEPIAHEPRGHPGGPLRDTVWRRLLGPRHIPLAFQSVARADPAVGLVINEYDLEFRGERYDARRAIMIDIVRQMQDAHVRVDAVGLQAHLYAHFEIDVEALAAFKEELERMGVGFVVTELDVIDFQIPGGAEAQDRAAERVVSDLLDAILTGRPPRGVVSWGITDRYSWVDEAMPHEDGTPSRPLPFDVDLRPKRWYTDMRERLASAV